MNVSPDALRKETVQLLKSVDHQIAIVREDAANRGTSPQRLLDQTGAPVMSPLLLAKAQCLNTLALLNEPAKRR